LISIFSYSAHDSFFIPVRQEYQIWTFDFVPTSTYIGGDKVTTPHTPKTLVVSLCVSFHQSSKLLFIHPQRTQQILNYWQQRQIKHLNSVPITRQYWSLSKTIFRWHRQRLYSDRFTNKEWVEMRNTFGSGFRKNLFPSYTCRVCEFVRTKK
jgi:hypothetical protein